MARVTVEDCIEKVKNRFDLIIAASQRAREIGDGVITFDDLKERYLKSLQKVVVNNDEEDDNDIEEEFSSYLNQEDTDQNLNPNNFFKNNEDAFEDVSDELIRKEE